MLELLIPKTEEDTPKSTKISRGNMPFDLEYELEKYADGDTVEIRTIPSFYDPRLKNILETHHPAVISEISEECIFINGKEHTSLRKFIARRKSKLFHDFFPETPLEDMIFGDRYEIDGEGAITQNSTVYKSIDVATNTYLALEIFNPEAQDYITRNWNEAQQVLRSLARIQHPNIDSVHELGEHNDLVYLVSDDKIIIGNELNTCFQRVDKPFSSKEILNFVRQMTSAFDYLHQRNVYHGSLIDENGRIKINIYNLPDNRELEFREYVISLQGKFFQDLTSPLSVEEGKKKDMEDLSDIISQLLDDTSTSSKVRQLTKKLRNGGYSSLLDFSQEFQEIYKPESNDPIDISEPKLLPIPQGSLKDLWAIDTTEQPVDQNDDLIGTIVHDRYQFLEQTHYRRHRIYLARDLHLGRDVRIKILDPKYKKDNVRLKQAEEEYTALSGLNREILLYDIGEIDGLPFTVMKDIPGMTIKQILEEDSAFFTIPEVFVFISQISKKLYELHENLEYHGDIRHPKGLYVKDTNMMESVRINYPLEKRHLIPSQYVLIDGNLHEFGGLGESEELTCQRLGDDLRGFGDILEKIIEDSPHAMPRRLREEVRVLRGGGYGIDVGEFAKSVKKAYPDPFSLAA